MFKESTFLTHLDIPMLIQPFESIMNTVLQKPESFRFGVFIEFRSLAAATFPNNLTVNSNKTPLEPGALIQFLSKDSSLCFFIHKAR